MSTGNRRVRKTGEEAERPGGTWGAQVTLSGGGATVPLSLTFLTLPSLLKDWVGPERAFQHGEARTQGRRLSQKLCGDVGRLAAQR